LAFVFGQIALSTPTVILETSLILGSFSKIQPSLSLVLGQDQAFANFILYLNCLYLVTGQTIILFVSSTGTTNHSSWQTMHSGERDAATSIPYTTFVCQVRADLACFCTFRSLNLILFQSRADSVYYFGTFSFVTPTFIRHLPSFATAWETVCTPCVFCSAIFHSLYIIVTTHTLFRRSAWETDLYLSVFGGEEVA